jgi:hypothetical protein
MLQIPLGGAFGIGLSWEIGGGSLLSVFIILTGWHLLLEYFFVNETAASFLF